MWTQINMLPQPPRWRSSRRTSAEEQARAAVRLDQGGCDAHTGITAGTFYRDEGWCFYQLGPRIERADQTTRLLDVKFLNFMAAGRPGSGLGRRQSATGTRCCARPPATRPSAAAIRAAWTPTQVAAFLLSDPCFPRSVACCLGVIDEQLTALRRQYNLRAAAAALQFLDEIRDDLEVRKVKQAIANGELHRFNDFLQRSFSELTTLIAAGFFGQAPVGSAGAA